MPQSIRIKSSTVAGKVPAAGDLAAAELGINLADQKLYSKDSGGTVFEIGGGSSVTVDDTAPATPSAGDLWWNTADADGGRLYVFYDDGSTQQWVEASPQKADNNFWGRTGTTLSPATAGDDIDLGTGDLSAAAGTFSGNVLFGGEAVFTPAGRLQRHWDANPNGGYLLSEKGQFIIKPDGDNSVVAANASCLAVSTGSNANSVFQVTKDGTTRIGGTLPASPNITLNANGVVSTPAGELQYNGPTSAPTSFLIASHSGVPLVCRGGNTGGQQLTSGATGWTSLTSESRLKNILGDVDADQAWDLIRNIKLKRYQYKGEEEQIVSYAGPMADWLGQQDPELLIDTGRSDEVGPIHTFNQPLLDMKALQALSTALTRIEALEAEVQSLKRA